MSDSPIDNSLELTCPQCGYDLRGLSNDRCPECGNTFDPASAALGRIPWSQRRAIGAWRAYWRTVWLALFAPARLGGMVAAPVSYRDAKRFRWITVALASALPLLLQICALYDSGGAGGLFAPGDRFLQDLQKNATSFSMVLPFYAGYLLWPTVLICIFVFILIVSRVQTFWFDRSDLPIARRNRAVAIGLYACAPLVWSIIPFGFLGFAFLCQSAGWISEKSGILPVMSTAGALLLFVPFIMMWVSTLKMLRVATDAPRRSRIGAAIGLPATWYATVLITFFVLPWAIGLVWIMIDSLV